MCGQTHAMKPLDKLLGFLTIVLVDEACRTHVGRVHQHLRYAEHTVGAGLVPVVVAHRGRSKFIQAAAGIHRVLDADFLVVERHQQRRGLEGRTRFENVGKSVVLEFIVLAIIGTAHIDHGLDVTRSHLHHNHHTGARIAAIQCILLIQHIEQSLLGDVLYLDVECGLHVAAIYSGLVHDGQERAVHLLAVSPTGFTAQVAVVGQLDTVLCRVHLRVNVSQGAACQRTVDFLSLSIALGAETADIRAQAEHGQLLYLLVLCIGYTPGVYLVVAALALAPLPEPTAELLLALVGEDAVQALAYLGLVYPQQGVALVL